MMQAQAFTRKQFIKRLRQLERSGLSIAVDIDDRVLYGSKGKRIWIDFWGLTAAGAADLIWDNPKFTRKLLKEARQCAEEVLAT